MLPILWSLIACQADPQKTADTSPSPSDTAPSGDSAQDTVTDSAEPAPEVEVVFLTEAMSDNDGTLQDEDGDYPDWIELYNPGPEPVSLAGWHLSDDPSEPDKWPFPAIQLEAGEVRIVFASDKDRDGDILHTSFKLSADGETVLLTDANGAEVDRLALPALAPDRSYGRAQRVETTLAVTDGSPARLALEAPAGWEEAGFDDGAWREVVLPVGFDLTEPVLQDAALGQETTQSSDGYGFTGAEAVDGDLDSFSHTGDGDLAPWWRVSLAEPAWIHEIVLENRRNCCPERLYNITVSIEDGDGVEVWASALLNPAAEGDTPADPGETLTLSLDAPVEGAAVRVAKAAVNGASSSEWMSMAAVEVHAGASAPYNDWIQTDISAEMLGVSQDAWLRVPVAAAAADRAVLSIQVDDAAEAWLDGAPVSILLPPAAFSGGAVLAIAASNDAVDDLDFLVRPSLTLQAIQTGAEAWFLEPTPGEPNGEGYEQLLSAPTVSHERGFYEAPFTATVTAPPGASLAYTLDGSAPSPDNGVQVSPSAGEAAAEISVQTTGYLRAMAYADGAIDSPVATHTWLFLGDVIRQPAEPDGFPDTWDGLSQSAVAADYEMDPDVVDDPAYTDDLLAGLRDIPTLSIVADPEDLFGADGGIYVHSLQRGEAWERPASLELILPDGTTGFATTSGLRLHGYGWRYHSNTLKHSLRLEFRSEYGPKKLEYPLFPGAPVDRFDSIVLRSQGSRGWQDFRDPEQAQYIRDAFARDTAAAMGKEEGHAAYVHLYLNGLYWGLYMPVERPDADFGAERFGGDADEYDAINRRTSTNEAIDGDLVAYEEMLALADEGLADAAGLAAIQEYLNLEDLIDYMLIHQYTVNKDGPEVFQSNNMRGVRKREPGAQFRFFVWDMEYSIWEASDNYNIEVDVPGSISHVYAKLRENPDFRAMYSERAAMHLEDALSPEACAARWEARAEEIERAIVAESARWGDTDRDTPYTRDVEWQDERQRLLTEFFPYRTDYLAAQLAAAGLLEE